jgi:decaprenyl-phosphate phosphoribosyltransferase
MDSTAPLAADAHPNPSTRGGLVGGVIRELRPKQWAKNALVFVAPAAAGVLSEGFRLRNAILAFVVFCAAAGATYLVNDAMDVEADRQHPRKRHRPIAAGVVPVPLAYGLAVFLGGAAIGAAFWRNTNFGIVVVAYVLTTTLYSVWLKHLPVIDMLSLASGFVLRLLGGAYATFVPLTDHFLLIACFGALFIAACKRIGEKREMGKDQGSTRKLLESYSDRYLELVQTIAGAAVILVYCQFALARAHERPRIGAYILLSILPFVLAILRYAYQVDQGKGSAPEDLVLGDRGLQLAGLAWIACMAASIYL